MWSEYVVVLYIHSMLLSVFDYHVVLYLGWALNWSPKPLNPKTLFSRLICTRIKFSLLCRFRLTFSQFRSFQIST
ncbi:hypothetical protein RchiOBHm_Chr7g0207641 [Rosa chinensis]|uniref:Uncharacterized protein n=1 Tax=Rosa chinensis TaxID=74649 RepID=A0A2P6P9H2_ROSCH|nr:hypothetical protein RchiOBHm_Chr7g0207641 [Rosa chinensis]